MSEEKTWSSKGNLKTFYISKEKYFKDLEVSSIFLYRNNILLEVIVSDYKISDIFDWDRAIKVENNLYNFKIDLDENDELSNFDKRKHLIFKKKEEALNYLKVKNYSLFLKWNEYLDNPTEVNYEKCYESKLFFVSEKIKIGSNLIYNESLFDQMISLKYFYKLKDFKNVTISKARYDLVYSLGYNDIAYTRKGLVSEFTVRYMGEYNDVWEDSLTVKEIEGKPYITGINEYFTSKKELYDYMMEMIESMETKIHNDYKIKEGVIF